MTDEELSVSDATLIARLRVDEPVCEEHFTANDAADRIEALVKDKEALIAAREMLGRQWAKDAENRLKAEARAERLETALREAAHAWATFKGATISDEHFHAVKRLDAALKGDDHE